MPNSQTEETPLKENTPPENPPEKKQVEKNDFKILSLPDLIQDNCKTKGILLTKTNSSHLFALFLRPVLKLP
jgi:hypothetical protein